MIVEGTGVNEMLDGIPAIAIILHIGSNDSHGLHPAVLIILVGEIRQQLV